MMKVKGYILLLGMALVPALCHAEGVCTWINRATATDSPDVEIRDAQTAVADGGSRCIFSYSEGGSAYNVQITVRIIDSDQESMRPEAPCTSAKTPLTGIGNEAVLCSADVRHNRGEQVIGRVRDKMFLVVVSSREGRDSPVTRKALSDRATLIAEQVAGNLL
jgi:hypothetical protein